jgi:hypothetical protein
VIALILLALFALRQKRRNQELKVQANPFGKDKYASWPFNFCYATGITIKQSVNPKSTMTWIIKVETDLMTIAPKFQLHGALCKKTVEELHS